MLYDLFVKIIEEHESENKEIKFFFISPATMTKIIMERPFIVKPILAILTYPIYIDETYNGIGYYYIEHIDNVLIRKEINEK